MSGRSTRSKNGCCNSNSSSVLGWVTSCSRRVWTASFGGRAVTPMVMRRTAAAASPAMMTSVGIGLHLDVDDAADQQVADAHADEADNEEDDASGQAQDLRIWLQHAADVRRADHEEDAPQADRQQGDHVPAVALHGGQRLDLALDADALADGEGNRVEHGGQVATHLALDVDGGDHQLNVLGGHATDQVIQRWLQGHAQAHLAYDALELVGNRRLRLARDQLDTLEEGRAG